MDDVTIDLRVAELLASRLCHDLVSPVGAVNNGLELMAEDDLDDEMVQDALSLADTSAKQASATVQFFRLAYGQAGRQVDMGPGELKRLVESYVKPHKAALDWQADAFAQNGPDGANKLLLNMLALALESLQRDGTLHVDGAQSGRALTVVAAGRNARVREETRAALADDADIAQMSPRAVHGYFTRLVARRMGGELEVSEASDRVTVHVDF